MRRFIYFQPEMAILSTISSAQVAASEMLLATGLLCSRAGTVDLKDRPYFVLASVAKQQAWNSASVATVDPVKAAKSPPAGRF